MLLSASVYDQLRIWAEKSADPVGKSSVEPNAKTASNHSLLQLFSVPDVKYDCVVSLRMPVDLLGRELGMRLFGSLLEEEGLEFIDLCIVAKVLRRFRHILND